MKLTKIPYKLTHVLLTAGASLILGFLSFSGMLAISPILPLAFAAFTLSVAYEGEIYSQNIKGALNKLFKHNHMKLRLASAYLLELVTKNKIDITSESCPTFFKDYYAQCNLLLQFKDKPLDAASRKRKIQAERTLRDMEKWFARQLFNQDENNTLIGDDYQKNLLKWLKKNHQSDWISTFNTQKTQFHLLKMFSALSAFFIGIGTTYLLSEAFAAIPLFASVSAATLPLLIAPMAFIAGVAYGLLTYNAVTDLLSNNRVKAAYEKIFKSKGEWTLHRKFMAATSIILATLALTLTICTAGTWWTVAKNVEPVFTWLSKIPEFVMRVVHPVITGISAFIFNIQNSAESLEIIDGLELPKKSLLHSIKDFFKELTKHEHWLQWFNPFRIILKLTITPLRILLFLGHLIGIGVTADRLPGVPEIISAIIGIICEGFEDLHYFVGHSHKNGGCTHAHQHEHEHEHEHEHHYSTTDLFIIERLSPGHSHSHDLDLPTKLLKLLFSPVYLLAALWDSTASRAGSKEPLTLMEAWNKQQGNPKPKKAESVILKDENKISLTWKVEHAIYRIERHKEKRLTSTIINDSVAKEQIEALSKFQQTLLAPENSKSAVTIQACIRSEAQNKVYGKRRFFDDDAATKHFLNRLPRVALTN